MIFKAYSSSSAGNLYRVISTKGHSLLLEAGLPIKAIRKALIEDSISLSDISSCLITHQHADHAKAKKDLIHAGLNIYCSLESSKGIFDSEYTYLISDGDTFNINETDFQVRAFRTVHDCEGSLGFLISDGVDKLLFAVDTTYLQWKFQGLTMIAIECNFGEELITGDYEHIKRVRGAHMSLESVIELLKANDLSKVREIHLLHLSDSNSNAELFQSEVQKLTGIPTFVAKK